MLALVAVIGLAAFIQSPLQAYDVDIPLNKTFVVKLPANPSTGYRWYWENRTRSYIVDSLSRNFLVDQPAVPGTGGEDHWTFKGIQKGTCTLHFVYKRPGAGQPTAQSKAIRVRVR